MADEKQTKLAAEGSARRSSIGASVATQILLVLVVLIMVNYLSMRHYTRGDWTSQNVYTMSNQTKTILGSLPREVDLIVMMSQGDALYAQSRNMFEEYVALAGNKLNVRYVDPDQNPTEFEHVLEQYPISAGITRNQEIVVEQVVVVTAGDSNRFVTPNEDFVSSGGSSPMDFGAPQSFNPPRAELSLTSAIYRVVAGRTRVICVTSGHGEWAVEGGGDRSLSSLSEHLERFEVELRTVELSINRSPDFSECAAVVVPGPRRPFVPDEARHLQEFVDEGGGDLIMFLDPIVDHGRFVPTGLEGIARRFGVQLENNEAVDTRATAPFCGGGHPTAFLAGAGENYICVSRARTMSIIEGREGEAFLQTFHDDAFGELNASQLSSPERDGDDQVGTLTLGAAVEQENEEARTARIERARAEIEAELSESDRRGSLVVVVGDSDLLNQDYRRNPRLGNFGLSAGLFNSVANNTVLVEQPPREIERTRLTLTDSQLSMALMIFVFGLPFIGIAAGVSMWWTRRQ